MTTYRTDLTACSCPGFWYRRTWALKDAELAILQVHSVGRLQHPDIEAAELTRMLNAEYVEPMRQRDAEGRVTGLTGQTLPTPVRTEGANLHPPADMLPDAVSEIKRLREMLLDLGVDPDG